MTLGFLPHPALRARLLSGQFSASDELLAWADRNRRWLFACLAVIYLFGFTGQWRMEPDAALFLSLGRNLADGRGYTYLGRHHSLAYPGLPGLWAITFKIFGDGSLLPQHIIMMMLIFAALAVEYRLFFLYAGRPTAVIITLGTGLTKTFFRYAYELRSDVPYTLGVLAFFAGYEAIVAHHADQDSPQPTPRRWYDWLLLVGGLLMACATRPTMAALLLAILGTILYETARRRIGWKPILTLAALLLVVVFAFHTLDPRRSSDDSYEQGVIKSIAVNFDTTLPSTLITNLRQLLEIATTDAMLQIRFGVFNIPISLLLIGLGIALVRRRVLWGLFVALNVAMMVVLLPLDRYFLPIIPLLVFAWWLALRSVSRWLPNPWGNLLFLTLFLVGIAPNIDKIGGILIDQRERATAALRGQVSVPVAQLPPPPQQWAHRSVMLNHPDETLVPAADIAAVVREHVGPNGIVLTSRPLGRITNFLSDRDVSDSPTFPLIEGTNRPIFVLEPADAAVPQYLARNHLRETPAVADVAGTVDPTWTLHATVRTDQ